MRRPKILRKIKSIVKKRLAPNPPAETHIKSIGSYKSVTIIRLMGSITSQTIHNARSEFSAKTKNKKIKNILFDLKEVTETDTSGIAVLIDLFRVMKTRQMGDKIGLINVPKKIKNLFLISKAKGFFKGYPSEEKAIKALE
ncbi:MAG: STAS domain-containing protein [Candidatus Omnitrophica bacterium]|nr:STAS domain-containing protein [Candidatus Omnitrophota bacterium]